jgi:hypothetical protein
MFSVSCVAAKEGPVAGTQSKKVRTARNLTADHSPLTTDHFFPGDAPFPGSSSSAIV